MGQDADLFFLLGRAHREALVLLCEVGQQPFSGLQAGARLLRKRNLLSSRLAKKLANLETAFAVLRHVTPQHVDIFLKDLRDDVKGTHSDVGAQPGTGPGSAPCPDTASCPTPDDRTATGERPASTPAQPGGDRAGRPAREPLISPSSIPTSPAPKRMPRKTTCAQPLGGWIESDTCAREGSPEDYAAWFGDDGPAHIPVPTAQPQEDPSQPHGDAGPQVFDLTVQDAPEDPPVAHPTCAYADFDDFNASCQLYNTPNLFPNPRMFLNMLESRPLEWLETFGDPCCRNRAFAAIHGLKQRPDLNGKLAWVDKASFSAHDEPSERQLEARVAVGPLDLATVQEAIRRSQPGLQKVSSGDLEEELVEAGRRHQLRLKIRNLRFFELGAAFLYLGSPPLY